MMELSKTMPACTRQLVRISLLTALLAWGGHAAAAETVKIFRSTMPDGSVVLSDKPSAGARSVASDTYVLTAPRGAAEAERDYWRRQAEAFNQRQQRRDATSAPRRARPVDEMAMYEEPWQPQGVYYGAPPARPLVPLSQVPPRYTTSPGAARGRSGGFIGSGFETAR
jgi:hypothetical protein